MSGRDVKPGDLFVNLTPQQEQLVADYVGEFLWPEDTSLGQKCVVCGDYFTGTLGVANFAGVQYPGPHGEGTCYTCGHPFRFVHDIPGVGKLEGIPLMYRRRIQE